MNSNIEFDGYWVKSGKNFICRYFVSWFQLSKDHYCGCVAGYSGHGAFEVEKFYLVGNEISISSMWVDFTDLVTGTEIDFDSLGSEILASCESCNDFMWKWNDYDRWCEDDNLVLATDKLDCFNSKTQDSYGINSANCFLSKVICHAVGLTLARA